MALREVLEVHRFQSVHNLNYEKDILLLYQEQWGVIHCISCNVTTLGSHKENLFCKKHCYNIFIIVKVVNENLAVA